MPALYASIEIESKDWFSGSKKKSSISWFGQHLEIGLGGKSHNSPFRRFTTNSFDESVSEMLDIAKKLMLLELYRFSTTSVKLQGIRGSDFARCLNIRNGTERDPELFETNFDYVTSIFVNDPELFKPFETKDLEKNSLGIGGIKGWGLTINDIHYCVAQNSVGWLSAVPVPTGGEQIPQRPTWKRALTKNSSPRHFVEWRSELFASTGGVFVLDTVSFSDSSPRTIERKLVTPLPEVCAPASLFMWTQGSSERGKNIRETLSGEFDTNPLIWSQFDDFEPFSTSKYELDESLASFEFCESFDRNGPRFRKEVSLWHNSIDSNVAADLHSVETGKVGDSKELSMAEKSGSVDVSVDWDQVLGSPRYNAFASALVDAPRFFDALGKVRQVSLFGGWRIAKEPNYLWRVIDGSSKWPETHKSIYEAYESILEQAMSSVGPKEVQTRLLQLRQINGPLAQTDKEAITKLFKALWDTYALASRGYIPFRMRFKGTNS